MVTTQTHAWCTLDLASLRLQLRRGNNGGREEYRARPGHAPYQSHSSVAGSPMVHLDQYTPKTSKVNSTSFLSELKVLDLDPQ